VGPLRTIVALEWHNRVIRPQKDVLVLFTHSSLCRQSGTACADVTKQVKEVATRLKKVVTLSVLTIDMLDNEVDITFLNRATTYPILVLFPATSKDQHVKFAWKTGMYVTVAHAVLATLNIRYCRVLTCRAERRHC
jgi:hypothetical protein